MNNQIVDTANIGLIANQLASENVFSDYRSRKAKNTLINQDVDLALFSTYLAEKTLPEWNWSSITWGLVQGFVNWQLNKGYSIGSINRRLSTIKVYAKLAFKAGLMNQTEYALIKTVNGYSEKESKRVNDKREITRIGSKKSEHTSINQEQSKQLKTNKKNSIGRRDTLLMCLLIDHGLRCGEIALLKTSDFNLEENTFKFDRPKVDKIQTHDLSKDTIKALKACLENNELFLDGLLIRSAKKGNHLLDNGMDERAITARVKYLGSKIGVGKLSAHDLRHYWATYHARRKVDSFRLQEAGGWSSLSMPRKYVENARIANEGMV